jgi:hypothetical protein
VIQDTEAPVVVSAISTSSGDAVDITYSEPVTGGTYSIGGLTIDNIVELEPNKIRLETSQQTEGSTYTITINGVQDEAATPNTIAPNTQVTFSAWVLVNGFWKFEYWGDIPGAITSDLYNNERYINNNPDWVSYISSANSREIFPDDSVETYGVRMSGFFVAPQTGDVRFFIRSDDGSELGINLIPGDTDPFNMYYAEAEEPNCCNAFLEPDAIQTTMAYPVEEGESYYLEFLYKENTGGDFGQVAFRYEGDTTPAGSLQPMQTQYLSTWANPDEAIITFDQDPVDTATPENTTATFTVQVTASPTPVVYQWQRAAPGSATFTDIAGANGASYTTPVLKVATDNGAKYRVEISVPGKTEVSAEALLTVDVDTIAPQVVAAVPEQNLRRVQVSFSEAVAAAGAEDAANYSIPGLTVLEAMLMADGETVLLSTTAQAGSTVYVLTVSQNVTDTAASPNPIDPDADTVEFQSLEPLMGGMKWEAYTGIEGTAVANLTNAAKFPDQPDEVRVVAGFEGPTSYGDNYGARISGFITPEVSGNYIFYMATDDNGELWLSTDDTPENLVLIATESNWSGARDWTPNANGEDVSDPIALQAGVKYYAELLYKEGTGGDNGGVAWKLEGAADPAVGSPPIGGSVVSTAVGQELYNDITLPTSLRSPLGSGLVAGFNARVYQVNQVGTTATQNEVSRAEQELAGCIDPNVADLSGAVDGIFPITSVINWNQDYATGDAGNFGDDDPIPGIPGVGSSTDFNTDNIAAEVVTYVEFPEAGLYTMGVFSDDGFNVTPTDQPPVHNRSVRILDGSAAGCYYALVGAISPAITEPIIGEVVLADPSHACEDLINPEALAGKIALIDRGVCAFTDKVVRAMNAGAIAVIVVNSRDADSAEGKYPIYMGGTYVNLPNVMIGKPDGDIIKAALNDGETVMADIWPDDTPSLGSIVAVVDTQFVVNVPEAGVYPMRMVWFEGGGGAHVEWYSVSSSGEKILLNDVSNPDALKTYQSRDYEPPLEATITIDVNAEGEVVLTYTGTLQSADQADGPFDDVIGATSPYVTAPTDTVKFYRSVIQ